MKHLLNNLTSEEKNNILKQHKGGMKIMTESFSRLLKAKSGDVKPLISENENSIETSLVGKSVKFVLDTMDGVYGENKGDRWSASEIEKESLDDVDRAFWHNFKRDIKGRIKKVDILGNETINIQLENLELLGYKAEMDNNIIFDCGADYFEVVFRIQDPESWFNNKSVFAKFKNKQLSDYLNNNLPCGGFDFAKNNSQETPSNFS